MKVRNYAADGVKTLQSSQSKALVRPGRAVLVGSNGDVLLEELGGGVGRGTCELGPAFIRMSLAFSGMDVLLTILGIWYMSGYYFPFDIRADLRLFYIISGPSLPPNLFLTIPMPTV